MDIQILRRCAPQNDGHGCVRQDDGHFPIFLGIIDETSGGLPRRRSAPPRNDEEVSTPGNDGEIATSRPSGAPRNDEEASAPRKDEELLPAATFVSSRASAMR